MLLQLKIFLLFFIFSLEISLAQKTIRLSDWEYRYKKGDSWQSGVPRFISLKEENDYDSLRDPLRGYGINTNQRYEEKSWQTRTFIKTGEILSDEHIDLVAEGISPYARVFVNGKFLFESGNYFLTRIISMDEFLRKNASNEIRIDFPSPTKSADIQYKNDKINYPSDNENGNKKVSQFLRLPPMCFGWDISPRLLPDRISENMAIRRWKNICIEDLFVQTDSITEGFALMKIHTSIQSDFSGNVLVTYYIKDKNGNLIEHAQNLTVKKGLNNFQKEITIKNPELWWPNGHRPASDSSPSLYKIKCLVTTDKATAEKEEQFGIRKIQLIRERDFFGESFYFKINGEKIFMKGANYVPDILSFQRNRNDEKFRKIIHKIRAANFNMIRVWGGGNYLSENELRICDESGILVWQDFIFSGTMYPSNDTFLKNIEEEAIFEVHKFRKHPCMALWCGNNEIEVAWDNWGWQKKYHLNGQDSVHLNEGYEKIFHTILPNTIKKLDVHTPYISTSPISNWGMDSDFLSGDNHYWGVWHGELPVKSLEKRIPRFMSEYGLPSFPSVNIIKKYFSSRSLQLNDSALRSRMRSYKGVGLIEKYVEEEYGSPSNLNGLISLSQILQAETYRKAIESHRRVKPYCMGTLFWQLNDAWPGISWSVLDYDLNEKFDWKIIKDAYAPVILSSTIKRNNIAVVGISDLPHDTTIEVGISISDFYGKDIFDTLIKASLKGSSSENICSFKFPMIFSDNNHRKYFLRTQIKNKISPFENICFFTETKNLALPDPEISMDRNSTYLGVSARNFVRIMMVEIELKNGKILSFPVLNLLPGNGWSSGILNKEIKSVRLLTLKELVR